MKKICPLCETENEEDARFCQECNEPLYDLKKEEEEDIDKETERNNNEDEWIPGKNKKASDKDESFEIMNEEKLPVMDLHSEGDGQEILKNEPHYKLENLSQEKETKGRKRKRLSQGLMELCRNPKSDLKLLRKYEKEIDRIENRMVNRNLNGKALEKEGKIDEAIKLYEKNIQEEFDGNFPYDRLAIIYSKKGLLDDEIRVLERGIWVFENIVYKNRGNRLPKIEKFKHRLEKAKKRRSQF